jgi:hypothetical protein
MCFLCVAGRYDTEGTLSPTVVTPLRTNLY